MSRTAGSQQGSCRPCRLSSLQRPYRRICDLILRALKRCCTVVVDLDDLQTAANKLVMESYRCSLPLCECDSLRCRLHITIRRVDLRNGVLDLLLTVDVRVDREITNRNLTVCACRDGLRPVIDVSCDFEFQTPQQHHRQNVLTIFAVPGFSSLRRFTSYGACVGCQHLQRRRNRRQTYGPAPPATLMDCIGAVRQNFVVAVPSEPIVMRSRSAAFAFA